MLNQVGEKRRKKIISTNDSKDNSVRRLQTKVVKEDILDYMFGMSAWEMNCLTDMFVVRVGNELYNRYVYLSAWEMNCLTDMFICQSGK